MPVTADIEVYELTRMLSLLVTLVLGKFALIEIVSAQNDQICKSGLLTGLWDLCTLASCKRPSIKGTATISSLLLQISHFSFGLLLLPLKFQAGVPL